MMSLIKNAITPLAIGSTLAFMLGSTAVYAQNIGDHLTADDLARIGQPTTSATSQAPAQQPQQLQNLISSQTTISLSELSDPNSEFYNRTGTFDVTTARANVIRSAARGVGIRGGFAYEAERINRLLLNSYRRRIERTYNFRPLMLNDGFVVPPVITRIERVRELNGPNFLSLTNGSFEITRDARLATQPPTWMDYLLLPIRPVSPPENIILDGRDEERVWSAAVQDSWAVGVREARETFNTALATLNRDYGGMRLYRNLASQGAVSIPRVDVRTIPWRIDASGNRAFEGETTLEIVVASQFRRR